MWRAGEHAGERRGEQRAHDGSARGMVKIRLIPRRSPPVSRLGLDLSSRVRVKNVEMRIGRIWRIRADRWYGREGLSAETSKSFWGRHQRALAPGGAIRFIRPIRLIRLVPSF